MNVTGDDAGLQAVHHRCHSFFDRRCRALQIVGRCPDMHCPRKADIIAANAGTKFKGDCLTRLQRRIGP